MLDNALANRLGYIGEITDATVDPPPRGISRSALIVVFGAGLVGGLITYAATAVTRRSIGDPEAIAYALGAGFLGIGAGFAWLAAGWPMVEPGDGNVFGAFIRYGNIWVPLVIIGTGALCLFVWWVHPENGEQRNKSTAPGPPNAASEDPA
ncbi:hypothetical protein AB0M79_35995 [Polymorphospora sp. NPDC051019]|uniref:hypothetical protein n=1 Tax=Polymorphospora sp. NPDC051019 TaxID=3155725 RepID=UPI003448BEB6